MSLFPAILNPLAGPEARAAIAADPGAPRQAKDALNVLNPLAGPEAAAAGDLTGTPALGSFLANLGSRAFWFRAAKLVLGGILMIIGLVKLTHADAHLEGAAGTIAGAAAKAP